MEGTDTYKPFNVNMGFFITICCMAIAYLPIICLLTTNLLDSLGFWDRLKSLPSLFQVLAVFSMFVGVGAVVHHLRGLVEMAFDSLFVVDTVEKA